MLQSWYSSFSYWKVPTPSWNWDFAYTPFPLSEKHIALAFSVYALHDPFSKNNIPPLQTMSPWIAPLGQKGSCYMLSHALCFPLEAVQLMVHQSESKQKNKDPNYQPEMSPGFKGGNIK